MNEDGQFRMPQQQEQPRTNDERFPYEDIKDTELEIEEMRALATEDTVLRYESKNTIKRWTKYLALVVKQPESLEHRLVDIESEIGGRLSRLPENAIAQRFWFHGGDWFYEVKYPEGPATVRFQVRDDRIFKLVGGKAIPFAEVEAHNLLLTIPKYFDAVRDELYGDAQSTTKNSYALAA